MSKPPLPPLIAELVERLRRTEKEEIFAKVDRIEETARGILKYPRDPRRDLSRKILEYVDRVRREHAAGEDTGPAFYQLRALCERGNIMVFEAVRKDASRRGGEHDAKTRWAGEVVGRLLDRYGDRSASFLFGRIPETKLPKGAPDWCGAHRTGGKAHPDGDGRPLTLDGFRRHVSTVKKARKEEA